jgi:glycosyltransferase involved in cell wall biosynthesis
MLKVKNVVILSDFGHINGGSSHAAIASSVALADHGYKVLFFTAVKPVAPILDHDNVRVLCTDQVDILNNPLRVQAACQGIWNVKAAATFSRLLNFVDPSDTVIHIHSWVKALSSSVVHVALAKGFKVVVTLHDYFSVCPNGGFFDYQNLRICTLSPLSPACLLQNCDVRSYSHKLWRVLRQIVQRRVGGLPSHITQYIVPSDFAERVHNPFLPRDARIYHISNPVNVRKSLPVDVAENTMFLFIGRLSQEKGAHLFAKAAEEASAAVTFVGGGPCLSNIKKICPQARVTGWLDEEGVMQHLRKARALVVPSLSYETQGVTVLEAAAAGVPSIVSDVVCAREAVTDGITGLWFRGGDVGDLLRKIRVLQDPNITRGMGSASYDKYWEKPFTIEKHVDELATCYERVLYGK